MGYQCKAIEIAGDVSPNHTGDKMQIRESLEYFTETHANGQMIRLTVQRTKHG